MTQVTTYKDLIVWQKSVKLVVEIYELTKHFPKSELYGLVSQMRRSAVSIASNIAEGRRWSSKKDYRQYLITAYGSGAELETQIEISKRLEFCNMKSYQTADGLLQEVMKMLNVMSHSLKK